MKENIFITGGAGMIGQELVPILLRKTQANIYLLVHEKGSSYNNEMVLKQLFRMPLDKDFLVRLEVVRGDVTKQNLGIDALSYKKLIGITTHIIHCAASTRFDLALDEARLINVIGTRNTVEFAKDCKALNQFGFVSTAYVSGKRKGLIKETDLEHDAGFVNTYEQSKYEAEILLQNYADQIPISIYRLSTVLGNSNSGRIGHLTAPHQAIRMMYLGLASMLPGTPDYSVDLISSDYTANTIFQLYWNNFLPKTHHITHGRGSLSLEEMIDKSYESMARVDPDWSAKNYPKPSIVSEEAFDLFVGAAIAANNPILKSVVTTLNHFTRQLLYPKSFDRRNLKLSLPSYETNLPGIHNYYEKIVRCCIQAKNNKL
jgi:thioester reductase-like protein